MLEAADETLEELGGVIEDILTLDELAGAIEVLEEETTTGALLEDGVVGSLDIADELEAPPVQAAKLATITAKLL